MATPTSTSYNSFRYGYSSITFSGDVVSGYHNISNNLRISMPRDTSSSAAQRGYFTMGSTRQDVLDVMGTPTAISYNTFSYRYSSITFSGEEVSGYHNISHNLLVNTLCNTSSPAALRGYFALGSTRQDVLDVMGTPSAISYNTFSYGYSSITFNGDEVSGYHNISNNLRVKIPCNTQSPAKQRGYFTVGSTMQDVLDVMGTPTSVSYNTYSYRYSTVTFSEGCVQRYHNTSNNLLIRD